MAWCRQADSQEVEFVRLHGERYGVTLNPEKSGNVYAPDLMHKSGRVADLKTRHTPFFTAGKYGFDPQHTVTFNVKDYERYGELYPRILLYFDVEWKMLRWSNITVQPMRGVWAIRFENIHNLCRTVHQYQQRVNDEAGNAKDSYLLDLRHMTQLNLKSSPRIKPRDRKDPRQQTIAEWLADYEAGESLATALQ